MSVECSIRLWNDSDTVSDLTRFLHRAYKPLADMGLRFLATHQDDATTLDRITTGICFVAEHGGKIIGTATMYVNKSTAAVEWYQKDFVARFGQLAVEPSFQKQGIASILMDTLEEEATKLGFAELALDTAEPATHLISYYERRGYRFIEYTKWDDANYRSVIMSKTLLKSTYA